MTNPEFVIFQDADERYGWRFVADGLVLATSDVRFKCRESALANINAVAEAVPRAKEVYLEAKARVAEAVRVAGGKRSHSH